jgi:hypothetical protein
MVHKENKAGRVETLSPLDAMPPEFAAMGKKRIEALSEIQMELLENFRQANRSWLERFQSEADLASEIGAKLTAARSIPEVATACQDWTNRRVEMATNDAKHIVADTQKIMATGVRMLSNGWLPNGRGGAS